MAIYTGTYTNDLGFEFKLVSLPVYMFSADVRFETEPDFDALFLPQAFKDNLVDSKVRCTLELGTRTIRMAKCFSSNNDILYITCPFRGNDSRFTAFFEELKGNPRIKSVGLQGENISSAYTKYYAGLGFI